MQKLRVKVTRSGVFFVTLYIIKIRYRFEKMWSFKALLKVLYILPYHGEFKNSLSQYCQAPAQFSNFGHEMSNMETWEVLNQILIVTLPQMMMKDSYLMPELDRIQASRGLILCWPILTGRNIEIFLVWSANIFPPCLGCLTADRLTAGCCSVKSRLGAGILILHLQSPSIFPSPLLQ